MAASPAPFSIAPFATVLIGVRFQPSDTGDAGGVLRIVQALPCPDTMTVALRGRGYRDRVMVSIPSSLRGAPGEEISIPLLISDTSSIARAGATSFVATLRFRGSLLMPLRLRAPSGGAAGGTITSARIDRGERIVTIDIRGSAPLGGSDTLGHLDALVLLGDTIATAIGIDTASFAGGRLIDLSTSDGLFTLEGLCVAGGERLVTAAGLFGIKAALPNPSSGSTEIIFATIENGPTSLIVHDERGDEVAWLLRGAELPIGTHRVTWSGDDIPSGAYEVVLVTPTGRGRLRLVVAR